MKNDKGVNDNLVNVEKKNKENIQNKRIKHEDIVNENDVKKPYYFGFKQRVFVLVCLIVLFFGFGAFLTFNSLKLYKGDVIKYDEVSSSKYKVCLLLNDVYDVSCLNEDMRYASSLVDNIPVSFTYNVDFSENIDYELAYHVIVYNKIYDKDNKDKLLYEDKEVLVDKTFVGQLDSKIQFDTDVLVDYKKYNDFVNNYKLKYYSNVDSLLEVALYLDETEEERVIGSVDIPLGVDTFEIKKHNLKNVNKSVEVENDILTNQANINLFFGSFLIVLSLILDLRLVRLVKATFRKRSKYEIELERILKEYDKDIVNIYDYVDDQSRETVKVESFGELVDAAHIISKPVLYNKINDVKSEFIVEDHDKLYKYVLKEADLED